MIVVSIIAAMSFIVISAIDNARDKNYESEVRSNFASLRVQAEKYYSKYNRFDDEEDKSLDKTNLCTKEDSLYGFGGVGGPGMLKKIGDINRVDSSKINVDNTISGQWDTVTCHASENVWAVEMPMEDSLEINPSMYCADSTGLFLKQNGVLLNDGDYSCLP
jgi:Tfp pilus assembly protein PilE